MNVIKNDNSKNTFSDQEISALVLTNEIVSGISIFSCLMVIILHWYFKEIRKFILNLVIWLCISNIFYCSTAYFPYDNNLDSNVTWCQTQAFMILFFQYSSWIISCVIGYSCFISVIKRDHLDKNKRIYKAMFFILTVLISSGLASM
jgi:hypothetical protein